MLHRASHLVAARLKSAQRFPRLTDSLPQEAWPRLREDGQPPSGPKAGDKVHPLRIVADSASSDLHLPERWDGLA